MGIKFSTSNRTRYSIKYKEVKSYYLDGKEGESRTYAEIVVLHNRENYSLTTLKVKEGLVKLVSKSIFFNFENPKSPYLYKEGLPNNTISLSNLALCFDQQMSGGSLNILLKICGYKGISITEFEGKRYIKLCKDNPDILFLDVNFESIELNLKDLEKLLLNFN